MTFAQAQREFQIRRYLWAKMRAAEEVREEFPHFWLFKGGLSWKFYQFLRMLDKEELELFVAASLRRGHRYAAAALGEKNSNEENAIEERYFKFQAFSPFEKEFYARKKRGDPIKMASRPKVQRAMINSFKKAFASQGLEVISLPRHPKQQQLLMRFCGWIVHTSFLFIPGKFNGGRSMIRHWHVIVGEERNRHLNSADETGPWLTLDLIGWLGLSIMEWDFLVDEDIEPACDSVIGLCREVFNEMPKWLKGLEREKVTE